MSQTLMELWGRGEGTGHPNACPRAGLSQGCASLYLVTAVPSLDVIYPISQQCGARPRRADVTRTMFRDLLDQGFEDRLY